MRTIDSFMVLKDHYAFKFIYGSRFLGQSKDKVFIFKMFVNLLISSVEFVKKMQIRMDGT